MLTLSSEPVPQTLAAREGQVHPLLQQDAMTEIDDKLGGAAVAACRTAVDDAHHLDLDDDPDSYHSGSSSVYSSPLEDEGIDDSGRGRDAIVFEDSEFDPSFVLDDEKPGYLRG